MANRAVRSSVLVAALTVPVLLTGSAVASAGPAPGRQLTIETVSNPRPALVSGGQVLVKVVPPERTPAARVRVSANGHDVTSSFHAQPDGSLLGLVTGLRNGANDLSARATGRGADLRVTNHPITGPVFSGSQQVPFYCETQAFGLPAASQPLCSAPTQVSYQYKTTAGAFAPLADPATRPADLATATVNGHAVPYVVRVERGTIDRAVYEMAALYAGAPSPFAPDSSWNGKLVYTFGGGCNAGYHQGASTGGVVNDLFLAQGYAVTSSSLNVLDNNCSPIISAEAAMMVKEHFIETYGPVAHTIGWGGSGGAIQQYDIAENYPGIVDGIIPGVSFPDPLSVGGPVSDCRLLNRYFAGPGASFTAAQKQAVAGFPSYDTCVSWDQTFASRATATGSCNAAIPVSARWDPVTNPGGVKCNSNEQLVNQVGRDPRTGFVRSTLDTTGVQYGLAALKAGTITAAQFVDLNATIGGLDYTGKPVAQRIAADPKALDAVYADDIVNSASQGLRETPIIDQRTDLDLAGFGNDIHTTEWSYVMRQRLLRANGTAGNQVIIENHATAAEAAAASVYELGAMDRWLTAIDADGSHRSLQQKVLANRPADLGDGCYLTAASRITEKLTYPASGQCGAQYPVAANTRMIAGESLSLDVLKCRLRPLDFRDYPVTFTAADRKRLRTTFPDGVCDYHRPGVGQHAPTGTWLSYGDERTGTTPPTKP
ncbi:DUF6351 family protein [Amycolatopsis sp. NPDC101161]|uniref:DUF6351 family protein n=1 Tax=Amycolatopsis sp. NPDC101161 TaxID=3363940 RepID=UPI0038255B10